MTGESLYPRDLIERLRGALDEAERIASAAAAEVPHNMAWRTERGLVVAPIADSEFVAVVVELVEPAGLGVGQHIAANDPAHVLRTIQAHRKIVEIHYSAWSAAGDICFACDDGSGVEATWPCATLRALASIYFPESDG